MIWFALWLGACFFLTLGYLLGHALGRSNGFSQAMKDNGWRPTLNGWRKEIP